MELFISHQSALEYWRRHRLLPHKSANRRYFAELSDKPPKTEQLVFSRLLLPVDIMVRNQDQRRKSPMAKFHVFSGQTPIGCFMSIGNDFLVSSPEFCFLQMAEQLTLFELIELGYELCGAYSLPLQGDTAVPEKGFYDRSPLTSKKKLGEFMDGMAGAKAHHKASRALRYVIDGSASPMETKLAIALTLPYKLGGYGFAAPELNKRVALSKATKKYFSKDYYVCDMFWPEKEVAAEYDSDKFHTGSERIANDSKKRNALATQGINVVSVTRLQLYNSAEFAEVARTLAYYLDKRLQFKKGRFSTAHNELRRQLL